MGIATNFPTEFIIANCTFTYRSGNIYTYDDVSKIDWYIVGCVTLSVSASQGICDYFDIVCVYHLFVHNSLGTIE